MDTTSKEYPPPPPYSKPASSDNTPYELFSDEEAARNPPTFQRLEMHEGDTIYPASPTTTRRVCRQMMKRGCCCCVLGFVLGFMTFMGWMYLAFTGYRF